MLTFDQLKAERDEMKARGTDTSALDAAIEAYQETLDAALAELRQAYRETLGATLAELRQRQAQERQARE